MSLDISTLSSEFFSYSDIFEKKWFHRATVFDDKSTEAILYQFPIPTAHKLKEHFWLEELPDIAVVQDGIFQFAEEEIHPHNGKILRYSLYKVRQKSEGIYFFDKLQQSVLTKDGREVKKRVIWILSCQNKFFVPESFESIVQDVCHTFDGGVYVYWNKKI